MNKSIENQRGAIAIIVAISMLALLAITALAVDVGHMFVVRNQVQNAVDAAALRGASFLFSAGSTTPDFSPTGPAVTNATNTVPLNISVTGNDSLNVQANYWQALNASAPSNEPAVEVDLTKQVQLYFAPVFGMQTTNVTAKAIALVQSPTAATINAPIAIGSCMYSMYWNSSTNTPINDPATNQPYVFEIGSSYAYGTGGQLGGTCTTGQWTPLTSTVNNSDSLLQSILNYGSAGPVSTGDSVWLQTGNENNLYNLVNNCSQSGSGTCEYATVPVVGNVTPGSFQTITALACLHIIAAVGGNSKYILVQMSTGCTPTNSSGSGTNYGVVGPPRLAQ